MGIGTRGLVQFIGFETFAVFGFFVLVNLDKLLQYFVPGQNVYVRMSYLITFMFMLFLFI